MKSNKKGFTLVEMLIVIVIIGILAAALIPRLSTARGKAKDVGRKGDLQQITTALVAYGLENTGYPSSPGQVVPSTTANTIGKVLSDAGLSFPVSDDATIYPGAHGSNTTGYYYTPVKREGVANNGFVVFSRAETEGGANYVKCSTSTPTNISSNTDVKDIYLCSKVTLNTAATTCQEATNSRSSCVATGANQLLYLQKY